MMPALVLMLTLSSDAGVVGLDPKDPLYASCPDAPVTVALDAGVPFAAPEAGWLAYPPARSSRLACLLETCDAKRKSDEKMLSGPQGPMWWVSLGTAFATGVTFAGLVAWLVGQVPTWLGH